MTGVLKSALSAIEWGVATWTLPGEVDLGDQYALETFSEGVLAAVIDGLGHGGEAAMAARIARDVLKDHANEAVTDLVTRCHEQLTDTRGVVMSLASFNIRNGIMTWLGVGNVEGVLSQTAVNGPPEHKSLLLRGGVVGYHLPFLRAEVFHVTPGDTLIMATDGIRGDFGYRLPVDLGPQRLADYVMARHATRTDDALVLVVRYVGGTQ